MGPSPLGTFSCGRAYYVTVFSFFCLLLLFFQSRQLGAFRVLLFCLPPVTYMPKGLGLGFFHIYLHSPWMLSCTFKGHLYMDDHWAYSPARRAPPVSWTPCAPASLLVLPDCLARLQFTLAKGYLLFAGPFHPPSSTSLSIFNILV